MEQQSDPLLTRVLRSEPIFYTLSGVFAGGGVERIASILAGYRNGVDRLPWPGLFWSVLLIVTGLCFALVADETEKYESKIGERGNLVRMLVIADVMPKIQEVPKEKREDFIEARIEESHEPYDKDRKKLKEQWHSKATNRFVFGLVCLAISVLGMGLCPPRAVGVQHPLVRLKCKPCAIIAGETSRLSWDTDQAVEVCLDGKAVPLAAYMMVRPNRTTTYTLRALGGLGKVETQVTIYVDDALTDATATPRRSPLREATAVDR